MIRGKQERTASVSPNDVDWDVVVAETWKDVEDWAFWTFEAPKLVDGIMARSADLNIVSQVTPPIVSRPPRRDYMWLVAHAMGRGAVVKTMGSAEWVISGDCSNPYVTTFRAPPTFDAKHKPKRTVCLYLDIHTRCRRCEACLRHRAALWRVRALTEVQDSYRTWFGTLTIEPVTLYRWRLLGGDRIAREYPYPNVHALDEPTLFTAVHVMASKQITLRLNAFRQAFKRKYGVRPAFKYLIVAEAHKSGAPHYHLLFHEKASDYPIRYEDLRHFWPHGFSQWKLVSDAKQATYLCKYLSKSMQARVRASQRYGHIRPIALYSTVDGISKINTRPHKQRATF